MSAFKATRCYGDWLERTGGGAVSAFEGLVGGHPFAGTLSVADMKLRIAQTMQNSESGRKLNQAVTNTSRAVGGALTTAKGAFSSWWTSFTAPPQGGQLTQAADQHPQHTSEPTSDEENNPADHSGTESLTSLPEGSAATPEAKHVIPTAELSTQPASNSVVEIGREAELLDRGKTPDTETESSIPRRLT
uniref:AVL9/DENND6 domain-containing protein n=1 Tax=Anopheles maculatus TaxID=74869 RepID=A0A182SH02_9DIPT